MPKNYDVFISYRREGGSYIARILQQRLEKFGLHADEVKLEKFARDFGIDAIRFEDLIERAEGEYGNVKP